MFLLMYLMFFGIDFLVLLYCGLCEKPAFRSFGWAKFGGMKGNTWKNFFLGLLIGLVMNGLCALLAWLHGDLDFSVGRFQFFYLLIALLCVCVQSAAEELVTRGYMMSALRERYNVWVAIAANSLLFGALHLMNDGITVLSMLTIILFGLFCSLIVYVLDSLWMSIAIHTAWNFTQSILLGLPNSGIVSEGSFLHLEGSTDSLYYDAVFGIEGSVSIVVMLTLLSAGLIIYGEKKKKAAL
jgi:membrane protease YdiL (CAAX protease family)